MISEDVCLPPALEGLLNEIDDHRGQMTPIGILADYLEDHRDPEYRTQGARVRLLISPRHILNSLGRAYRALRQPPERARNWGPREPYPHYDGEDPSLRHNDAEQLLAYVSFTPDKDLPEGIDAIRQFVDERWPNLYAGLDAIIRQTAISVLSMFKVDDPPSPHDRLSGKPGENRTGTYRRPRPTGSDPGITPYRPSVQFNIYEHYHGDGNPGPGAVSLDEVTGSTVIALPIPARQPN